MRLRKGQVAPGISAKSKRIDQTINARYTYLLEIRETGCIPEGFIHRTTNQALATWSDEDKGIFGVSLNRLKKERDLYLNIKSLSKALATKSSHPQKRKVSVAGSFSKNNLEERISKLYALNKQLTDQLGTLRTAYLDLKKILEGTTQLSRITQEAVRKHRLRFPLTIVKSDDR